MKAKQQSLRRAIKRGNAFILPSTIAPFEIYRMTHHNTIMLKNGDKIRHPKDYLRNKYNKEMIPLDDLNRNHMFMLGPETPLIGSQGKYKIEAN